MNESVELSHLIPRGSEPLCRDCRMARGHRNHSMRNHNGHYFNESEEATISDRSDLHPKEKYVPPPMAEDERPCRTCGQTRATGHHRGRRSHPYDPPPPEPVKPTQAAIYQALEQALATMGICRKLVIKKSSVEPQFAVDGTILMAKVNIAAVLFFNDVPPEQLELPKESQ